LLEKYKHKKSHYRNLTRSAGHIFQIIQKNSAEDNCFETGITELHWRSSGWCHLLQYGLAPAGLFNAFI